MTKLFKIFSSHDEVEQYIYFTENFKGEDYRVEELKIDGTKLNAKLSVKSSSEFNVSMLLLDRMIQSLGFVVLQYIRLQQKKPMCFLFVRRMEWHFSGPIRPSKPLLISAAHHCSLEQSRKEQFEFQGNVNNRAFFSVSIDAINPSK
ncbi:hypothetical protein [Pseudochrobactrum sp. MP213Fo]|uniref:hypothetical protein n=1 Tax=Pseudochrobactrum sp. MP213Fo TaxID=3022250 RepID=UPI003B9E3361